MSRIRHEISSVQFQVDASKANASMNALKSAAKDLNQNITETQEKIRALGDVPVNDANLVKFRKELRGYKSDLRDVEKAQRELVKGVKAADDLFRNAQQGTIEKLSVRSIKAGQRGLQQRMNNLNPDDAKGAETYRAFKAAIEEADVVIKKFEADAKHLVDTINQGGEVSKAALTHAKSDLEDLMSMTQRGSKDWKDFNAQLTTVETTLNKIKTEEARTSGQKLLGQAFRGDFATADQKTLENTIAKLKEYRSVVDDPNGSGGRHIAAINSQIEILQGSLNTLKGGFASVDEVLARFNEHMNAGKAASVDLAKVFEERLNSQTSIYDDLIKHETETLERYEQELKESTDELNRMEQKLAELEQRHANSSWLRKQKEEYRVEEHEIERLRADIEGYNLYREDNSFLTHIRGQKEYVEDYKQEVNTWKERLEFNKQCKAEELGLSEESIAAEQRQQEATRLTNAQMQEGIKLLEQEYAATDHTTEEGIRRRSELRSAIDQMNQEIKESTGEWMTYAEAEKYASQAGSTGFIATQQQMQQAQQALERKRDSLIKTIQKQKESNQATAEEEAQLKKVEAELKKMKFEMDNVNMSAQRMEEILDDPKAAVNIEELGMAVKRAQAQLKLMENTVGKGNEQYDQMAEKVQKAAQRQKELESQFKSSATAFEKAWSRLKTYVTLYVSAAAAIQKLTASFSDLMELSDKMGEVRKTTGFTADEVARLSENLKKLDVRTSLVDLMDISAKAGQLGLKTIEDVEGFTIAANKLMIALPEMGTEAATEMMRVAIATGEVDKIRKQLEEGTIEGSNATAVAMEKIASTIDRLRASSASTAPEITDFVKRVGAVGAQSGITIDQVSALGSTISSLGLRIEMSATALSRMIPAIRRNAFEISQAIGVSPEALRSLFDAGRGMEAVLMILQHMKDANMDEDSIEKLLGMGGMQEVMKELNQQGARAGIVFAGLSQNVDELRRQLGVAAQAYEENIAIQQEFDRMNETTAAKWERFKNEIEEAFVRDEMQRGLGFIIDSLRVIVNLLTGNVGPAIQWITGLIHVFLAYFGVLKLGVGEGIMKAAAGFKSMGESIKGLIEKTKTYIFYSRALRNAEMAMAAAKTADAKATAALSVANIKATMTQKGLNKAMLANIWAAVAAAIIAAAVALYNWIRNIREAAREAGRFEAEAQKNIKAANKLIDSIGKARVKIEDAETAVRKARKELEAAKEANDGTTKAVKRLKDAETELLVQEEKKRIAMAEHKRMIESFNTQYSKYLGFMLSEVSSNIELAKARDLVNSKLRETIYLKQQEAGLERVEKNMGEARDERYGNIQSWVNDKIKDPTKAARVMQEITRAAQKEYNSLNDFKDEVLKITKRNKVQGNLEPLMIKAEKYYLQLKEIKKAQDNVIKQTEGGLFVTREQSQKNLVSQVNEAFRTYNKNLNAFKDAKEEDRAQAAANVLQQMDQLKEMQQSASSYYKMDDKKEEALYKKQMGQLIGWQGYNRNELQKIAGKLYNPRKDVNGEMTSNIKDTTNGGWGKDHEADSTAYADMNATALVARRKQMKDFVNAIQTDSDVKTVLAEDKALAAAIEKGMSSDMRTVVEWYNTERLKIQDELYKRHLTNTGDWLDPKKSKESWRKQLQMDLDNYLKMLDAYYTKRKAEIQEAGNDEGLTEAEIKNRQLANDTEWQQRRMELQQIYLGKREKIAKDEVTAIMNILAEMDEDTPEMVEKLIGKSLEKWKILEEKAPEMAHRVEAKFVSGVSQSMLKMQQIVHQQMKAIQDIIDKERPFNGITKNLRENLVTMGILTADMTKERDQLMKDGKDMSDFNRRQAEEEVKRTTFMLSEAENAYSTTVEDVMRRMADKGMAAWADQLKASPEMQEGMMAQLRATYDAIQDAIKKEASLMKKQAEVMWNNILLPGGDGKTTVKEAFEKTISQLGIEQGRVSRANSLIGAGAASDRVADKLAIKQMQLQLTMQTHYYNLMRKQGLQRIKDLERQRDLAKEIGDIEKAQRLDQDRRHVEMSLRLAMTKEQTDLMKQQEEIIAKTEESENALYKQLKEWSDLISSSFQSVFEASNAGNREYYNERAKLDLTGKGGPGAGTYIVIENEGTDDAKAHYEYLDEREALERQHEIEVQNARADAWKKLMDDINMKMSEQITDWLNASMQSVAVDNNTEALKLNTEALYKTMEAPKEGAPAAGTPAASGGDTQSQFAYEKSGGYPGSSPAATPAAPQPELTQNTDALQNLTTSVNTLTERLGGTGTEAPAAAPAESVAAAVTEGAGAALGLKTGEGGTDVPQQWPVTPEQVETIKTNTTTLWEHYADAGIEAMRRMGEETADLGSGITDPWTKDEEKLEQNKENQQIAWDGVAEIAQNAMGKITEGQKDVQKGEDDTEKKMVKGSQSAFAKMASAANMYGIAYQTMSNDNLSTEQKFQAMALQMAGQSAIAMMQTKFTDASTNTLTSLPEILANCLKINPIAGAAIFAVLAALLGAGLGVAASKLAKGKSEVSKITGASASAGRLSTGMMTYAKGNINELSDPDSLVVGHSYNVDGADGKTYRAKYTGKNAKTHITNGPEFHLVGEKGQEAIIDAHTTKLIRMNDTGIWHDIQTLYNGGSLSTVTRRRRSKGVKTFADGNLDDFEDLTDEVGTDSGGGLGSEQVMQLQASLDRNSDVLERAMTEGIKGVFNVYGKGGLVDSYDTGKKTVTSHGERY